MAGKLDDFWLQLRVANMDIPAIDKLTVQQPLKPSKSYAPSLSNALEKYCRLKGGNKSELFFTAAHRNVGYVIERLGDRFLNTYSSSFATMFGGSLIDKGLSVISIRRMFSCIFLLLLISLLNS